MRERRRLAAAVEELEARGATQVFSQKLMVMMVMFRCLDVYWSYELEARGATQVFAQS